MTNRRRKASREKDLTSRYLRGDFEEDRVEHRQIFSQRSKEAQQNKILRTAILRAEEEAAVPDIETLPIGQVVQVYSLYSQIEHNDKTYLCVVRKTLTKVTDKPIIVGDRVRFRPTGITTEAGQEEAVIEQILPRETVLTRADSFKAIDAQPIVANAQQMLIVASLRKPSVKWGLIDRMIVAAQSGGLQPIVCLNKIDLASLDAEAEKEMAFAQEALAHYRSMQVRTLQTSVQQGVGLDELREMLKDHTTVLAGHSGVGKSSLIRAIQPSLDLRIGKISEFTDKGRHTTTSSRRYVLDFGGQVIDTPGVKLFGLWGVTPENLSDFFPDVSAGTAPQWRMESYQRMAKSL